MVEHYYWEALDTMEDITVLEKLDAEPTMEVQTQELRKAIDALRRGKVPGKDGMLAEIIKADKLALLLPFHELLYAAANLLEGVSYLGKELFIN